MYIYDLLTFIESNKNWFSLLTNEFFINIKNIGDLYIFNYNQFKTNFSENFTRACRGTILKINDKNIKPVCVPFYKFFNYNEKFADNIDFNTAKVLEKIDGSLIKVYYNDGEWRIATNSTIDAREANIQSFNSVGISNFYDLFIYTLGILGVKDAFFKNLDKDYTYMFELATPLNRVVIEHNNFDLYFLSARNIKTFKEENLCFDLIKSPKEYKISNKDDVILAAKELPKDKEGFVVVDKDFNRIKIKSPNYILMHGSINNNVLTKERLLDIYENIDYKEFVSYFKEYKEVFDNLEKLEKEFNLKLEECLRISNSFKGRPKKELVFFLDQIKFDSILRPLVFLYFDGKEINDVVKKIRKKFLIERL